MTHARLLVFANAELGQSLNDLLREFLQLCHDFANSSTANKSTVVLSPELVLFSRFPTIVPVLDSYAIGCRLQSTDYLQCLFQVGCGFVKENQYDQ